MESTEKLIRSMMEQSEYLITKEMYMRYHYRLGAREALNAFRLAECFLPQEGYKYTNEEITEEEEKKFISEGFLWRQEEIIGAKEALRAAGVSDDEIVEYIVEKWGITERYAKNHMEDIGDFAERVGGIV